MANCIDKIDLGLIIKKPNIILPWCATKKEILSLDQEFRKENDDNYYSLKVELENLTFINSICLFFKNERLSELTLFYAHENDDLHLRDSFLKHQEMLESYFGMTRKLLAFKKFFKQVNKGDIELEWKFKNISIIHKLWDRFGLEEILKIIVQQH